MWNALMAWCYDLCDYACGGWGVCRPCVQLPIAGKDHKDKVKPVFIMYRVWLSKQVLIILLLLIIIHRHHHHFHPYHVSGMRLQTMLIIHHHHFHHVSHRHHHHRSSCLSYVFDPHKQKYSTHKSDSATTNVTLASQQQTQSYP